MSAKKAAKKRAARASAKKTTKKKATKKKTSKKKTSKKKATKKKVAGKKKATRKKTTKKKAAATKKKAKRAVKKASKKKTARKVAAKATKKKTATQAAKGKAAVRAKLSKSDLNRFRALLLAQREKLLGDLESLENQAFKTSGQDSSANHMADHGSDNYEQAFNLGLIENEEEVLRQIDRALERIEKGEYGTCEICSQPIPIARLEFLPWTPYCVRCKEQLERPY